MWAAPKQWSASQPIVLRTYHRGGHHALRYGRMLGLANLQARTTDTAVHECVGASHPIENLDSAYCAVPYIALLRPVPPLTYPIRSTLPAPYRLCRNEHTGRKIARKREVHVPCSSRCIGSLHGHLARLGHRHCERVGIMAACAAGVPKPGVRGVLRTARQTRDCDGLHPIGVAPG